MHRARPAAFSGREASATRPPPLPRAQPPPRRRRAECLARSSGGGGAPGGGWGGGSVREFERDLRTTVPLRTKGKPERDADGKFNKGEMLRAATTWQEAVGLFRELGPDVDSRSAGLVAQMFKQAATLLPGPVRSMPPLEAAEAEAALDAMLTIIVKGVERLKGFVLKEVLYRLVDTGLQRPKAVAALGVALTGHILYMKVEEAFDAAAALALLQYRQPSRQVSKDVGDEFIPDLTAILQDRSIRAFRYFTPKDTANAVFVFSRVAPPGSVSREWLHGFEEVSFDHLPQLQGEALALAGYMPARHGHLPGEGWRQSWIDLVGADADGLAGTEFALVLFALAKWQQLAADERAKGGPGAPLGASPAGPAGFLEEGGGYDGGYGGGYGDGYDDLYYGGGGARAPQRQVAARLPSEQLPPGWLDALLLASHRSGALRELTARQLSSMLRAMGALGTAPSAMWMSRAWQAVGSKAAAAARAGAAGAGGDAKAAAAGRPDGVASFLAEWAALPVDGGAATRACPSADLADELVSYAEASIRKLPEQQLRQLHGALEGCGGAGAGVALRLVAAAASAAAAAAAQAAAKAAAKAEPKRRARVRGKQAAQ